ncbi:sensor histidine kinase [Sphingomonas adhaesiva]|uniref:sensor histidine kinase n=1 Tax=Sphingomonas adhaesiva TaxID=28212 RepID=UPI002FF7CEF7
MSRRRTIQATLIVIAALVVLGAALYGAQRVATARAIDGVSQRARASAILLASSFRRELDKFRLVPVVLADDREARDALATRDPARLAALNRKLEVLSTQTGAANVYLLDAQGRAVATSNWRRPESFLGDDYAYRGYYRDAIRTGVAQQFALGQRSRMPGLYISKRVDDGAGRALGVFVVKVDFRSLEREWRRTADAAFVTDARGIILVTAQPAWRFQTIRPLSSREREQARRSLEYGAVALAENPLFAHGAVAATGRAAFVEAVEPIRGWRVHVLVPTAAAVAGALAVARLALAILAMAAVGLYLLWRWRRRREAARVAAAANARLAALRHQLVQANKLATLGQVTSGVGHEINQPVAAIAAYAHNARLLIERGRAEEATEAIAHIVALTQRIGVITRELRGFARRASGTVEPVAVAEVFDGVRLLLRDRLQALRATFMTAGAEAAVRGERVRLEQVMVNLVQNALDAGARTVTATVDARGDRVRITVADDGPGIDPAMRDALFQPFRTSKADGLGLGLVIAHDIVADLGGTLSLGEAAMGATFVIDLERAA